MEYEHPNQDAGNYIVKFVRIKKKIIVTVPYDINTTHESLAKEDGLLEELKKTQIISPYEVDAGFATFGIRSRHRIRLGGRDYASNIPKGKKARQKTVTLFRIKTPGYAVKNVEIFDKKLKRA